MLIRVNRFLSTSEATLSSVYVDEEPVCYGCEDEYRAVKAPGETRIPAGVYKVALRTFGGKYERYKKDRRVRDLHDPSLGGGGMLWIKDVPNFEHILIHIGNTETDTEGCLLVGAAYDELTMTVSQSVVGYRKLYKMVRPAAEAGHLTILFEDND